MVSKQQSNKQGHLFTVEILIEEETNGKALEKKLLGLLDNPQISDYRIIRGIALGPVISAALNRQSSDTSADPQANSAPDAASGSSSGHGELGHSSPGSSPNPADKPFFTASAGNLGIQEVLQEYRRKNVLVRLNVIKAKGIKLSLPCRILNMDAGSGNVSVYHVDEKTVYTFHLNEIDEIVTQ